MGHVLARGDCGDAAPPLALTPQAAVHLQHVTRLRYTAQQRHAADGANGGLIPNSDNDEKILATIDARANAIRSKNAQHERRAVS
jgi:hypothetical protein